MKQDIIYALCMHKITTGLYPNNQYFRWLTAKFKFFQNEVRLWHCLKIELDGNSLKTRQRAEVIYFELVIGRRPGGALYSFIHPLWAP